MANFPAGGADRLSSAGYADRLGQWVKIALRVAERHILHEHERAARA
jgi:hypothetical protein